MELLDARLGGTIPLDIVLYPPPREEPMDADAEDGFERPEPKQYGWILKKAN